MPGRLVCTLLAALLYLVVAPSVASEKRPPVRVLFVGNSHTATHDLPLVVATLARERGVEIETVMLAEPGLSLGDHLARRELQRALREEWHWAVLQQGPSSLPESRTDLIRSAKLVANELKGRAVRIALMSTWPHRRYLASSLAAEESYRLAAEAIGACVMPAATAWRHALGDGQAPRLYQRDQLHATRAGTVLAALSILPGLVGEDQSGLRTLPGKAPSGMSDELHVLRAAAWRAHQDEPLRCTTGVER